MGTHMKLIVKMTEKLQNLNRYLLGVILQFGLPRYGKKLMLLVSVFSGLRHLKAITPVDLERLNTHLGLASCTEALEFPALVSKVIWKGCKLNDVDFNTTCSQSTEAVLENIPKWLRYDTDEKMAEDIRNVVNHARMQAA